MSIAVTMVTPEDVEAIVGPVQEVWAARGFGSSWRYEVEIDEDGVPLIQVIVPVSPDITVDELKAIQREVKEVLRAAPSAASYFPHVSFPSTEPAEV